MSLPSPIAPPAGEAAPHAPAHPYAAGYGPGQPPHHHLPYGAAPYGYAPPLPVFAAPHDPRRTRLWFSGRPGEFVRLLVRGALLSLLTFGFYRFWLLTDIRRHLWANTRIGGESLEYTGTARELLLGFLIALAILAPLYAGYFIVATFAETYMAFAGLALTPLLYVFGQYASYRARRYRATRTLFRGVRFSMAGSAWAYAGRAALWDLATVLSLGLAYPWRVAALERYKMRHTFFGDLAGDFAETGGTLFRRGWWMWALTVGLPVVGTVVLAAAAGLSGGRVGAASFAGGFLTLGLFVAPFLYPLFLAMRVRWRVEGVRFGAVSVANNLPGGEVFLAYLKLMAASFALSLACGILGAGLFAALFGPELFGREDAMGEALAGMNARAIAGLGLLALVYLVFLQGTGVLKRYFVDRGLWLLVAFTSSLDRLEAADHVRGGAAPASAVGEGLADALDVGAF